MDKNTIRELDPLIASKIAAGEVVERPASVVKELVENSIDSGATSISVHLAEGGCRLIRVVDNGCGISNSSASLLFRRHSTSKINSDEDLLRISTMGFRGEALSSISAVARVIIRTHAIDDNEGISITSQGVDAPVITADGCPRGTNIEVQDLFYNTPARLKFLRSTESELSRCADVVKRLAIANPSIRFKLTHNEARLIESASTDLTTRVYDIYGKEVSDSLIGLKGPLVVGCVSEPKHSYPSNKFLNTYVNKRWVRDRAINRAIMDAYSHLLQQGRYPFVVLDLKMDPADVDVNIHPTKAEVRFKNPSFAYDMIKTSIKEALLLSGGLVRHAQYPIGASMQAMAAKEAHIGLSVEPIEQGALTFTDPLSNPECKNPELSRLRAKGQLWAEFLIAESDNNEDYYIIDQHGAAERIAFERLKKAFVSGIVKSQTLLIPERLDIEPGLVDGFKDALPHIRRMGFMVEEFGPAGAYMIRAVPYLLGPRSCKDLLTGIASDFELSGGSERIEAAVDEILMRIACHSVIRGASTLTIAEGDSLIRDLSTIDLSSYCPHGRPVVKKASRTELEAFFKRS